WMESGGPAQAPAFREAVRACLCEICSAGVWRDAAGAALLESGYESAVLPWRRPSPRTGPANRGAPPGPESRVALHGAALVVPGTQLAPELRNRMAEMYRSAPVQVRGSPDRDTASECTGRGAVHDRYAVL